MFTRVLLLSAAAVLTAACSTPPTWPHPLTPLGQLAWPHQPVAAMCDAQGGPALPALPVQTGALRVEEPGRHLPAGVVTTLDVVALTESGAVDAKARGRIGADLGGRGEVVEVTPLNAGHATVRIRVAEPGPAVLHLQAGVSAGAIPLRAYETRLPVWELSVEQGPFDGLATTPHEDRYLPARLSVGGVDYDTRVRLHGGTSRDYPKKSFRFDLADGYQLDGRRRIILRSEWNDKTMLRNWLAHDVFRRGTWLPTPATRYVHLRVNGRYYGLMLHVERIDRDFLSAHALDPAGELYEADPPLGGRVGDMTPLPPDQYPVVYGRHAGAKDHEGLRQLIEEILPLAPEALVERLPKDIAVDDVLVYLAAMAVLQNHDHVRKNYYVYRSPSSGGAWTVLPWDLDLTFGHMWSEGADVLGEEITTNADPFVGSLLEGQGQHNALIERVLAFPELRARMVAMAQHIASTAMTPAAIDARITSALCDVMPDLAADTQKRASNDEYLERVAELRNFVGARGTFLRTVR